MALLLLYCELQRHFLALEELTFLF
ncbi:hypothetical protein KL86DES1_21167 [uncultured Desulfovibrio sp.]|uniref:Uncharacterized protein n=1 Tax=uncultured Desulfovibrio sp. TaxID=167968 RepID=A0A212L6Q9_9BACT|nr:hypothetical protein KL86DES1_21167 [uncultured Desulfovibrio sp.]VZH34063.1 conserved protein of unknown function [Desulfovibrio sp. 86]